MGFTSKNIDKAIFLLIVESPSKCAKIEGFLGSDYACIASKGHLQTISGLKSIDTKNNYNPTFNIIPEKEKHILSMRNIINKFSKDNIFLATDDDREGEAIAWHICQLFNLNFQTTKRVIFHEITKDAIVNAVKEPTIINMNIVQAQFSRQILDIIIGFKISPFLWKYLYNDKNNSLSAGRCQTPALRLIYDNNKKNTSNYKIKYKICGIFTSLNLEFVLNKCYEKDDEMYSFLEKNINWSHKLTIGETTSTSNSPPLPFSTSRLLQVAGNVLNLAPKHTMSICQKLYQAGYITYMRTESTKYSKVFIEHTKNHIKDKYGEKYIGDCKKIENFDINNPHEAIRVTNLKNIKVTDKDPKTNTLYKLIYDNTVESCMEKYTANVTNIKIDSPEKDKHFEYKHEKPIFLGWKILKTRENDIINKSSGVMLYLQSLNNTNIKYNLIKSNVTITTDANHYSEHSLINKLESLGIGRPSTFATIIDVIQQRNYVEKKNIEGKVIQLKELILEKNKINSKLIEKKYGEEKNKLVITNLGILTLEFLVNHFENIFSYDYTKKMEKDLDDISSGLNIEWNYICNNCDTEIKNYTKEIKNIEKCSYSLDEEHEIIFERYGPCMRKKNENNEYTYYNIKQDFELEMEKIINKEYSFNELLQEDDTMLGKYKGYDIYKKIGRYGPYVEYNNKKESIKEIKKGFSEIKLVDVVEFLEEKGEKSSNIFREFTPYLSIRKGKYGAYAYYKKPEMKKPQFFNIKKFENNFLECEKNIFIEWLNEKYNTKYEDFV